MIAVALVSHWVVFPLAFVFLALSRGHAVTISGLLPDTADPGKANANLTFVGIAAVTIGALASVVPLDVASGRAALGLAAAVLVIGRYAVVRFDRFIPVPDELIDPERLELHSVAVRLSASALASTRGAVGFLIVSVGFLLRMAGEPTWVIAALVAAAASGEALGLLAVRALGSKAGSLFAVATALAAAGPRCCSWRGRMPFGRSLPRGR